MGIILVYDLTNYKSFENISKWLRNINEHANEDVEKLLLGNKCDMSVERVVSEAKGKEVRHILWDMTPLGNYTSPLGYMFNIMSIFPCRLLQNTESHFWKLQLN